MNDMPTLHSFTLYRTDPMIASKGLPPEVTVEIEATHEQWSWGDLGDCQGEMEHFSNYSGTPDNSERQGDYLSRHFKQECTCNAGYDHSLSEDPEAPFTHDEDCMHDYEGDPNGWRRLPAQSQGDSRESWWRPGDELVAEEATDEGVIERVWTYIQAIWSDDAPCVSIEAKIKLGDKVIGSNNLGLCFLSAWSSDDWNHEAEIRSIAEDHGMVDEALCELDDEQLRDQGWEFIAIADWTAAQTPPNDAPPPPEGDRDNAPGEIRIHGWNDNHPITLAVWDFANSDGEPRTAIRVFFHPINDADETHHGGRQIELDPVAVRELIARLR